ncbi:hypothetical protein DICSQDRAFT_61271 [Dichomitus squalens LYAD-421 SS1]|uniref:Photolyase/cryptochrome alpha/beta domain-containing protein n=1 Tax=Dichomitus squalens (strain LYAD-421) TaxID=732165 RepID=R7SYP5_DICSQ|nr:uncharacterized protein DICSQDRAFT_61271 [Dichomitus squalens LYAD-421 SS1]EJF61171.1 hypothetical protein DICSQDRAFT_61271 [Dichomitus squalens LYAD-421 SS1]
MGKRARSLSSSPHLAPANGATKKKREVNFSPNRIATAEHAAKADASPPLFQLVDAVHRNVDNPPNGECVVYWMRMEDLRIRDNRAIAQASAQARKDSVPLIVLHVLSPQDYIAHDRSARKIDFVLRNLQIIRSRLSELDIPLYTVSHEPRTKIPAFIHGLLQQWKASHLFANMEYEVDELRRDIALSGIARKHGKVSCTFLHDRCIVPPGEVTTKDGRGYTVYSPFLRTWKSTIDQATSDYIGEAPLPVANDPAVRSHPVYSNLFDVEVPHEVEGFTLDPKVRERMASCWPAGEDAAHEVLRRFLETMSRTSHLGVTDPLSESAKMAKNPSTQSRLGKYNDQRDRVDADTTSRMSPYLAAGVISARTCVREALETCGKKKVDISRDTGVGRWIQEIAWRDFYNHILAFFPRVSMGRPFLEKYAHIQWETNEAHLQAWKDGRTGVPVVDAAMRQANTMGWMHNRGRMIAAMYLTKDLLIDWRLGERYFMEVLIDGDLASNNGGWQWSASTGVDPAPYFRIFNPYTQSQKIDPGGEYIRAFVPELAKVRGPEIHKPPPALADKLGYPRALVEHDMARKQAIERYKNIGKK